jgi:hypothetical protein
MAGFPRILKNPCASKENRFPKLNLPTVYQRNRRAKLAINAEDIMKGENIGEEEKEFISIIAILHDIGAIEVQKNTVLLMVSIKKRKDQK